MPKFTRKKEKEYTQNMTEPVKRVEDSLGKMLLRNLLGGIVWGIGVTLGATIFLAIFGYFIGQANYVPVIGSFVADIVLFVEQNTPQNNPSMQHFQQ